MLLPAGPALAASDPFGLSAAEARSLAPLDRQLVAEGFRRAPDDPSRLEFRRRASPQGRDLDNDGSETAFVALCGPACSAVYADLSAVRAPTLSARLADPRAGVLRPGEALRLSPSHFTLSLVVACGAPRCAVAVVRYVRGDPPDPARRGILPAPSRAEFDAAPVLPPGELARRTEAPTPDEISAFYPTRALRLDQAANVRLACLFTAEGRLRCRVDYEDPPGLGFGQTAIGLASLYRYAPTSAGGVPIAGRRVYLPLRFVLAD